MANIKKDNLKVAFVWDFSVDPLMLCGWDDGLKKALEVLAYEHGWIIEIIAENNVDSIHARIRNMKPDVILCWGSLDRPSFAGMREHKVPVAICFAGGNTKHSQKDVFDIIFVESDVYEKDFEATKSNWMRAFGTNQHLFQPMNLAKKFLAFYGTTYAIWKRHYLFAEATKEQGITAGRILQNEYQCFQVCKANKVTVLTDLPCQTMPYLYNQSKFALVTCVQGGQRNVLEAMACNVIPVVMADNPTTCEFVKDSGFGVIVEPEIEAIKEALSKEYNFPPNMGRDYVMKKWTAEAYAEQLRRGIESIL